MSSILSESQYHQYETKLAIQYDIRSVQKKKWTIPLPYKKVAKCAEKIHIPALENDLVQNKTKKIVTSFFYFQYLSIVKKLNTLGCNDQFFNLFINLIVFFTSFTVALINNEVPGRRSLNHLMCTGENPKRYEHLPPKVGLKSFLCVCKDNYFQFCHLQF